MKEKAPLRVYRVVEKPGLEVQQESLPSWGTTGIAYNFLFIHYIEKFVLRVIQNFETVDINTKP